MFFIGYEIVGIYFVGMVEQDSFFMGMQIFALIFRHYFSWVWKNNFELLFGALLNEFMDMKKKIWTIAWGIAELIHGFERFFLNGCLRHCWILICESILLAQWHFLMGKFFARGIFIWLSRFFNEHFLECGILVDIMMIDKFCGWPYFRVRHFCLL